MKSLRHAMVVCGLCTACGGSDTLDALANGSSGGTPAASTGFCESRVASATTAVYTPLTMRVPEAPRPVLGSDGRHHLVYEIELVNGSAEAITLTRLSTLDASEGGTVATLEAAELSQRLVVRDMAARPGTIGAAQAAMLYLHLTVAAQARLPTALEHRLEITHATAPPSQTGGCVAVPAATELVFDAPLRGARFIAGDGCCDTLRHTRATLPLNGRYFTAQRFAIDWERLDAQGRIYAGDPKDVASYFIYNEPAHAVADGTVVSALDGLPDSPPGSFPDLPIEEADGNHVVLDLGNRSYALYAHFKPGSVQVKAGDRVRRGALLGRVGSSGRSSEPHLHFHVTNGPSPLASEGVPYRLANFSGSTRGVSTAAFDQAIIDGLPIATEPVGGVPQRERMLPLDLWIVDLPE